MIRETLEQGGTFAEQEESSKGIREAHSHVNLLRRRLDRLAKLQSLLKEKHHNRLDGLSTQLSDIDIQKRELKDLTGQLKGNKDRQSIIKKQMASLDRREKALLGVARQIARYGRSSNAQIAAIEEEQEILSQQVRDLEQTLGVVEQAELNKKELEIIVQRIHAKKGWLEEHVLDLSKRTMDLLFDFYMPPGRNSRFKL